MFSSVFDLVKDVATVVTAPVKIAVDIVSVPVGLLADAADTLVKDVKSLKD